VNGVPEFEETFKQVTNIVVSFLVIILSFEST